MTFSFIHCSSFLSSHRCVLSIIVQYCTCFMCCPAYVCCYMPECRHVQVHFTNYPSERGTIVTLTSSIQSRKQLELWCCQHCCCMKPALPPHPQFVQTPLFPHCNRKKLSVHYSPWHEEFALMQRAISLILNSIYSTTQ